MRRTLPLWLVLAAACAEPQPRVATEEDIERLEPAVRAGDRAAIRALFDCDANGAATTEYKCAVLGTAIRVAPRVFLEELVRNAQRRDWPVEKDGCLDCLLGHCPELVDDFPAQEAETRLRAAALASVDGEELRVARDACLRVLAAQIELVSGASASSAPR